MSINSDTTWLKFAHTGKTLFVAKRPVRHSISWNMLNAKGIVFGKELVIGGNKYKIRLLTGGNANPAESSGGEWNDLMYRISAEDPTGTFWARYTSGDLNDVTDPQLGHLKFVQEASSGFASYSIVRGYSGQISSFGAVPSSSNENGAGWLPVLELIP